MPTPLLPLDAALVEKTGKVTRVWAPFFQFFSALVRGSPAMCTITYGTGSPENVIAAPVGSLFIRTNGGASTVLYIKEANTTAVGWRAV